MLHKTSAVPTLSFNLARVVNARAHSIASSKRVLVSSRHTDWQRFSMYLKGISPSEVRIDGFLDGASFIPSFSHGLYDGPLLVAPLPRLLFNFLRLSFDAFCGHLSSLNGQLVPPSSPPLPPFDYYTYRGRISGLLGSLLQYAGVLIPPFGIARSTLPEGDSISVAPYNDFLVQMNRIFQKEFGVGVVVFSGFIRDGEEVVTKDHVVFGENPLVGNLAFHSPAHLLQTYVLFKMAKEAGLFSETYQPKDFLSDLVREPDSYWGNYLDVYRPRSLTCPHYVGLTMLCTPDSPSISTIQAHFRHAYALGIRGAGLRLGCNDDAAAIVEGMMAQDAADFDPLWRMSTDLSGRERLVPLGVDTYPDYVKFGVFHPVADPQPSGADTPDGFVG